MFTTDNAITADYFTGFNRLLALILLLVSSGCSQHLLKPVTPQTVSPSAASVMYQMEDFDKDRKAYISAIDSNSLTAARRLRDRMINRIRTEIEANYRDYETQFFADQAGFHVIADWLELALSLATTVAGDKGTKTILGAVLTAAKGGRLSYDKNFFREKTSELIISKMQANRDRVKARILDKMANLSVDNYPFEEAFVDLVELFNSGTLQGALVALANDAGKDAVEAKEEVNAVELFRTATVAQVVSLRTIRDGFTRLYRVWRSDQKNPAVADPLLNKAKSALKELGVPFNAQDTGETIFANLNKQISRANTEADRDSYLKKLSDAFRNATILEP